MGMDKAVQSRYKEVRDLAYSIVNSLREEASRQGFTDVDSTVADPDTAEYELQKDPANGEYSLVGKWRSKNGGQAGLLLFHSDGSFFVEHDIVMPHPVKSHMFVEAVEAWGRDDNINVETKLLPMPK